MDGETDRELALQALLTEYGTLRTEIQSRSDIQNRFMQLHITAIGLVIGFVTRADVNDGLIVLLSITSSVFGLWWTEQAITIARIGFHISDPIERDVNALLGGSVLRWESGVRNPTFDQFPTPQAQSRFEELIDWSFIGPAGLGLLFGLVAIAEDLIVDFGGYADNLSVWLVLVSSGFCVVIIHRQFRFRAILKRVVELADTHRERIRDEARA